MCLFRYDVPSHLIFSWSPFWAMYNSRRYFLFFSVFTHQKLVNGAVTFQPQMLFYFSLTHPLSQQFLYF